MIRRYGIACLLALTSVALAKHPKIAKDLENTRIMRTASIPASVALG